MTRWFQQLFSLEVRHDYYTDSTSEDLIITPLGDTNQILKNHRMKLRKSATGLTVFFEATDNAAPPSPLLPVSEEQRFRFAIHLGNSSFYHLTELPQVTGDEIYYFKSEASPTDQLTRTTNELKPTVYNYSRLIPDQGVSGTFTVTVTDHNGTTLFDSGALTDAQSTAYTYEKQFDFTDNEPGLYNFTIVENTGSTDLFNEDIYIDGELKSAAPFAIAEIFMDSNDPARDFHFQFDNKEAVWKYFVVVTAGVGSDTYTINDNGGIAFTETTIAGDDLITEAALLEGQPGTAEVVMFQSGAVVPFIEAPRLDVSLLIDDGQGGGAIDLISDLPGPGIDSAKAEVFVYV